MTTRNQDEEVVGLRATGTSFRAIARELGMSLGGVQRALRRAGLTVTTAEPVEW